MTGRVTGRSPQVGKKGLNARRQAPTRSVRVKAGLVAEIGTLGDALGESGLVDDTLQPRTEPRGVAGEKGGLAVDEIDIAEGAVAMRDNRNSMGHRSQDPAAVADRNRDRKEGSVAGREQRTQIVDEAECADLALTGNGCFGPAG